MNSLKIWFGIAVIASIALIVQQTQSPDIDNCDENGLAPCDCTESYENLSNSYMSYTFGLIILFFFRFYHLCSTLPPADSRRKIKIQYRIACTVFAVLFTGIFAWVCLAFDAYEFQCEDSHVYDETKQMSQTLRVLCGIHCLFAIGSLFAMIGQNCHNRCKNTTSDGYLSSDQEDDKEFDERAVERDNEDRRTLQSRIE